MKNIVIAICLFLATCTMSFAQTTEPVKKEKCCARVFCCPMHNDGVSNKCDKCSKCGMKMVKGEKIYECSMCHVTSKTAGKCPKCGMEMTEKVIPKKHN